MLLGSPAPLGSRTRPRIYTRGLRNPLVLFFLRPRSLFGPVYLCSYLFKVLMYLRIFLFADVFAQLLIYLLMRRGRLEADDDPRPDGGAVADAAHVVPVPAVRMPAAYHGTLEVLFH